MGFTDFFGSLRKKGRIEEGVNEYFKLLNAYTPAFTTYEGGLYEMELTRAAINSFAQHVGKLHAQVLGNNNGVIERKLQYRPNPIMDSKKYLSRLATCYKVDNNVFIAPLKNPKGEIVGFLPLPKSKCELVDFQGTKYLRYKFGDNNIGAVELEKCGILNQMQYKDDLLGENNKVMRPTLELINVQNQGIINGVQSAASIRFMAKLGMTLKESDIEAERKRFVSNNLSAENSGGVLLFDQKYADVKQIDSRPYVVNPTQMAQIKENVYSYFGTNEKILQNKFTSAEWNAYYEGAIEPFAVELGLVHTNMLFSEHEVAFGNEVIFSADRMQYMSAQEKLQVVTQLFDRGFITLNEGRKIFNMSYIDSPEANEFYIRKEYTTTNNLEGVEEDANDEEPTVQADDVQGSGTGDGTEEL